MTVLKFTSTLKKLGRPWQLSPFLQNGWVYLAEILYSWYQNEINLLTEFSHSDGLKIHVNPSKIYINPGI